MNKEIQWFAYLFLVPLTIILPFSGPLIPALIVLVTFFILLDFIICNRNRTIRELISLFSIKVFIILIPASLLSLYSLFLGFYDSSYQTDTIPLMDRFARLPKGVISQVFHSLGFPLMLMVIVLNLYIIKKRNFIEAKRITRILKWFGTFSLFYILLLPFGGYRPYRPIIIRYDTFMPINVLLMFLFGMTTFYLIQHLHDKIKRNYSIFIIIILMIYTFSDSKGIGKNKCERAAFEKMALSQDSIVSIPKDCFVMSWQNNFDYKQSEKRAEVIHFWGITSEKKLFYNVH